MSYLKLKNVKKSFGEIEIIHGVDLDVTEGEFCVFVGPSGCGKSTLLRLIAGLETVSSGSVSLAGRDITEVSPSQRDLAMVFQSYALYPHKTVRQNLGFALMLAKTPKDELDRQVNEAAEKLQLTPLLDRKPGELSGGQRQRVAIGRSIVRKPKLFLFDEPLSNLDAALRVQMRIELAQMHQQLATTMVYVTHDQVEAMTLANRVVVLRDGIVEQQGAPMSLYLNPINRFVAGFMGTPKMNFMDASVDGSVISAEGASIALPAGLIAGDVQSTGSVGFRPEHMEICNPEQGLWTGEVLVLERMGGDAYCHVKLASGEVLLVRTHGRVDTRTGETIGIRTALDEAHVFDGNGSTISQRSEGLIHAA